MKIKIIDKYGFSKLVKVEKEIEILYFMTGCGLIRFELFDISKNGTPLFKQVSDL